MTSSVTSPVTSKSSSATLGRSGSRAAAGVDDDGENRPRYSAAGDADVISVTSSVTSPVTSRVTQRPVCRPASRLFRSGSREVRCSDDVEDDGGEMIAGRSTSSVNSCDDDTSTTHDCSCCVKLLLGVTSSVTSI